MVMWLTGGGGAGEKKRQTSFRFLKSLREVLTKRVGGGSGGLTVYSGEPHVLSVKAMSTNNVTTEVDVASQRSSTDNT